jgi:hypothetical protein
MIESKMSTVSVEIERQDVEALIDQYGRDAAGEAFLRAIEARALGDHVAEQRWVLVAAEVMMVQRVRAERG